ncbi:hypothetical protein [Xanthomonas phage RTH11]|nr:hypothetical protein [Xanthomonas phage RTH11]
MATKLQQHFQQQRLTVSQEGFFDKLKNLFGGKPEPEKTVKKDEVTTKLDYLQQDQLLASLSNANEMRKLKLRTDSVPGKRIAGRLLGDATKANDVATRLRTHVTILERLLKEAAKGEKRILAWMFEMARAIEGHDDDQALQIMLKSADGGRLFPYKLARSEANQLIGVDNIGFDRHGNPVTGYNPKPAPLPEQLPALTAAEIQTLAKAVKDVVKRLENCRAPRPVELYGPYEGERAPLRRVVELAFDANDDRLLELFARKYVEYGWTGLLWSLQLDAELAVEAIEEWMFHSIDWSGA